MPFLGEFTCLINCFDITEFVQEEEKVECGDEVDFFGLCDSCLPIVTCFIGAEEERTRRQGEGGGGEEIRGEVKRG